MPLSENGQSSQEINKSLINTPKSVNFLPVRFEGISVEAMALEASRGARHQVLEHRKSIIELETTITLYDQDITKLCSIDDCFKSYESQESHGELIQRRAAERYDLTQKVQGLKEEISKLESLIIEEPPADESEVELDNELQNEISDMPLEHNESQEFIAATKAFEDSDRALNTIENHKTEITQLKMRLGKSVYIHESESGDHELCLWADDKGSRGIQERLLFLSQEIEVLEKCIIEVPSRDVKPFEDIMGADNVLHEDVVMRAGDVLSPDLE